MRDGQPVETSGLVPYNGHNLVHPDFVHGFEMLRGHLAFISESREAVGITLQELDEDEDTIKLFRVHSFKVNGYEEVDGVILQGDKRLQSGDVMDLPCPLVKWVEDVNRYPFADELSALVDHLTTEALSYLDGKIAPSAQLDIFEDEPEEE
ncbi:hypothetical protein GCM10023149_48850 [Mucilaginibacter gynuensis]|uniref:Uncharacterized protein n=1 Tax=Mucilaginibacter gynuensis TaxID=1302236 RepID=A0ABP8HFK5_9SPHI